MRPQRRTRRSARAGLLTAVILAAAVIVAASVQLSGPLSVITVVGDSMEPGIGDGDLVVLRKAGQYEVGDIAAYQHPDVGLLLHRIIALDGLTVAAGSQASPVAQGGGRLVFQGDNRARTDPYHPLTSELQGRVLWRIPGGGNYVRFLRSPTTVGALAGGLGLLALFPLMRSPDRRGRVRRRLSGGASSPAGMSVASIFALTALGAGAALVALHFLEPTRMVPVTTAYEHRSTLNYGARGGDDIYDSGFAKSGDPIFRALADAMAVHFDYRFESELPAIVSGSYRLSARLSHTNGWVRTIEILPERAFDGTAVSATGILDFERVQALIDQLREQTGVTTDRYLLTLGADVDASGTLAGKDFDDGVTLEPKFLLDSTQLQLVTDPAVVNPFTTAQAGVVANSRIEDRSLGAAGLSLRVVDAEMAARITLGVSLLAVVAMGAFALLARQDGEAARIRARYGKLLVPAKLEQLPRDAVLAEVSQFSDLLKLAQLEGLPILDEQVDVGNRFLLVHREATYYYQTDAATAPAEPPATSRAA